MSQKLGGHPHPQRMVFLQRNIHQVIFFKVKDLKGLFTPDFILRITSHFCNQWVEAMFKSSKTS